MVIILLFACLSLTGCTDGPTYEIHAQNNIDEPVNVKLGFDGVIVCEESLDTSLTGSSTICRPDATPDGMEHQYWFHVTYLATGTEDDLRITTSQETILFGIEPDGLYWT